MVNVIPFWWSLDCWRQKFPSEESVACNIDIKYLKETHPPETSHISAYTLLHQGRMDNEKVKSFTEEVPWSWLWREQGSCKKEEMKCIGRIFMCHVF